MDALLLLLACFILFGFGYWLMCRLDVFLKHSGPLLHWDEEEEPTKKSSVKKSA